ncbi:regulator of G-protein signaling 4-like isoform X1 [Salvelinus fontinalis]|nr:regulator of G-protein signaling 4-like isoform X1 [Salvelinus fontinalis]
MCKGLSSLPSSCLEKAKGMRVKLSHLADKQEWTHHKHRVHEDRTLQGLESLLNGKIGQKAFLWFLQSEFSEENLQFWLACEEYRVTPPWQQGAKAQSMYCQYINPGSPQEVNLDAETREALLRVMEEPAGDTFHEAQQHVYHLMAKDSYPRFLRSPHCLEALRVP